MANRTWIRKLFGRKTRTVRKDLVRLRPRLEALEDRLAPAILTVNSLLDTASARDGYLSLREALPIVNTSPALSTLSTQRQGQSSGALHAGGTDTIQFDHNQVTGPITLGGTELELSLPGGTASITITGGAAGVTVDGNHASRIFRVDSGTQVTISGLTIQHGLAANGGGIMTSGNLTLTDDVITGNTAQGSNGVIATGAGATGGTGVDAHGGGVD